MRGRFAHRLGRAANGGELVRLDARRRPVVSSYGGWVNVSAASSWSGKGVHRLAADRVRSPDAWNRAAAGRDARRGTPAVRRASGCDRRNEHVMSGHNRWSKIKHKKEASDSKKSKLWTKVIKELTISARLGGGDINGNPRLRAAVDKARTVNMPNDTIDRAIKKGTGDLEGITYEEFNYEVFGPGGTAVLVEIMTDNRNRTASEIRSADQRTTAATWARRGPVRLDVQEAGPDRVREGGGRRGEADRPGDRARRRGHPHRGRVPDCRDRAEGVRAHPRGPEGRRVCRRRRTPR